MNLERITSKCACETELRDELGQNVLIFRETERNLQEMERGLRNQLEQIMNILRKTEKDLQKSDESI